ncbi:MAG: ribonuclease III [Clostridiales bacterium]|nr:ribonuclease III [Clostridiales bacterium]
MNNLEVVEQAIGYKFNNANLLLEALTHISYANESHVGSYDRLEYLGDAVIELVVSDYIYHNLEIDSGLMSRLRSTLVSTDYLSNIAQDLTLVDNVLKAKSLRVLSKKNQADLFESVIGAVYIDGGLGKAKEIIDKFVIINKENVEYMLGRSIDPKTRLQELLQAESKTFGYELLSSVGLDHDKTFSVGLMVDGVQVVSAKGKSIQLAEEKCASEYLKILGIII